MGCYILKEFDSVFEVAKYFKVKELDVVRNYESEKELGKFFVDDKEIKIEFLNNRIKYVYVNEKDDKDCRKYLMKYEVPKYNWKVHIDDIEGFQDCKVIKVENIGLDIIRAIAVLENGIKVKRFVEYAPNNDSILPNLSMFMIEKDEI